MNEDALFETTAIIDIDEQIRKQEELLNTIKMEPILEKTIIDEDCMTIEINANQVLVANNEGVDAYNLHASTYLIIGDNSRFEDYNNNSRTGCFWIK